MLAESARSLTKRSALNAGFCKLEFAAATLRGDKDSIRERTALSRETETFCACIYIYISIYIYIYIHAHVRVCIYNLYS